MQTGRHYLKEVVMKIHNGIVCPAEIVLRVMKEAEAKTTLDSRPF